MNVHEIIVKKRDGIELSREEIEFVVDSCVRDSMPLYQLSAFLMAVYMNGMSVEETVSLTEAMIRSGETLSFELTGEHILDKHSTGGVGDKVSLVLLPIAVECGLRVPMISGRSLGFTGGTLDKLESIPGLRTSLSSREIITQVEDIGGCFAGQTKDLVPADRVMYAVRDATGTVESLPLIVSSILSKKMAEGVEGVVIDVKCGRGAFMEGLDQANALASMLEEVGERLGFKVKSLITSMEEPLGRAVGNALEVAESLDLLSGEEASSDLCTLTHRLVSEMLFMAQAAGSVEEGTERSRQAVESGRALDAFLRIVEAQGGRVDLDDAHYGLPVARCVRVIRSRRDGFIRRIDARIVGEALREMGGGRFRMEDTVDPACGFIFRKKSGESVEEGEPLFEVHASSENAISIGVEALRRAVEFGPVPPEGYHGAKDVIISR